jgi:DNA-directed RNA polymerase specialized sigma24 family protein
VASYRQIAARLRMTERTVERRLLGARAAVRRADAAPPHPERWMAA